MPNSISSMATDVPRSVRSFVVRGGRTTRAQRRAIDVLWARFGLEPDEVIDPHRHFGRPGPLYLEIGFGNGEALLELAAAHPSRNYVGVEVHPPGIGRLLAGVAAAGIDNIRVIRGDALEVLEQAVADGSLAGINVWFPDPWPKKRHHKRRLVQPATMALMARRLAPGGILHLATDWQEYAEHMLRVVSAVPGLANLDEKGAFYHRPTERPVTRFQRRGEALGHGVWDLLLERRLPEAGDGEPGETP
ncbi:MAG: tRNA (guanosine(46)-N7)-methyltransferase TrmB [Gammaproteobacteria bacterium]|nr:tRNA (guanosine(46)-N7)-methyltransferase TrmB [Gammaproteobacteria bacterium]